MKTRWLMVLALVAVMVSSNLLYGADKGRTKRSAKSKANTESEALSLDSDDDSDDEDSGASAKKSSAKSKKSDRKSKRASAVKGRQKKTEDPESVYESLKAKRDKLWKALDRETRKELEAAIEEEPEKSATEFKKLCPKGMTAAKFQRCVTAGLEAEAARLKCEGNAEKEAADDEEETAGAGKKVAKTPGKPAAKQAGKQAKPAQKKPGDGEEFSDADIEDADVPAAPARPKQRLVKRGEYDEETDEAISMGETFSDDDGDGWRDPGNGDDFSIDEKGKDESSEESDFSTGHLGNGK